jgi:hypothetical protein
MALVDVLLLLAALLCVLQFAVAASYRFRRRRHDPAKEITAHLAALTMVVVFTVVSGTLNKREFAVFGIAMIVVMAIYYAFIWAGAAKPANQ